MTAASPTDLIVSADWLAERLHDPALLIVDVRSTAHYQQGHIPGAVSLDLYPVKILDSDPDLIDEWVRRVETAFRHAGIDADRHVVFYEDISGTTAARGVWLMHALSIGSGSMLDGGLHAWQQSGGPISQDHVEPVPSMVEARLNPNEFATATDVLAAASDSDECAIIDTRADLEWMQGTVPTAKHVEWTNNLRPDGTMKPLDELRELYSDLQLDRDAETITFCASGYRAAHTWLVLRMLGYDRVRNYAPSWGEWGRRDDLPVAPTR